MKKLNCKLFLSILAAMFVVVCFSQNGFSQTSIVKNHFKSINQEDYKGKKIQVKVNKPDEEIFLQKNVSKNEKSNSFSKKTKPDLLELKSLERELPQVEYTSNQYFVMPPQQIKGELIELNVNNSKQNNNVSNAKTKPVLSNIDIFSKLENMNEKEKKDFENLVADKYKLAIDNGVDESKLVDLRNILNTLKKIN